MGHKKPRHVYKLLIVLLVLSFILLDSSCAAGTVSSSGNGSQQNTNRQSDGKFGCTDWKEQTDGLKVRLYTTKENWQAGEEVEIRMEVWNPGNSPVEITTTPYKCINISLNGAAIADEIGESGDPRKNIEILEAGSIISFVLTRLRTDAGGDLQPGVYTVRGAFGETELPEFSVNVR